MDSHPTPDEILGRMAGKAERFTPPPKERGEMFGRLRVLSVADAALAPARHHLLRDVIARGELSEWWGAPKCGKSFLMLRIAFGLALGRGMFGKAARPCRVLYVAAEGEGGFAGRIMALRSEMGDPGDAFGYIAQRAEIGPPYGDLADVIAATKAMRGDLVVLDTLARTFGAGDENTSKDMGAYVGSLDKVREDTGAHVAVIHHGRKDDGDQRGSNALPAAADLIVKVARGKDGGPNTATIEQAKEDPDGMKMSFVLRVVDLGLDEEGVMRRTCIAEEAEGTSTAAAAKQARMTARQQMAADALRNLAADGAGQMTVPIPGMPFVRAIPRWMYRAKLVEAGFFPLHLLLSPEEGREGKVKSDAYSKETAILAELKQKHFLGFNRDAVWLA